MWSLQIPALTLSPRLCAVHESPVIIADTHVAHGFLALFDPTKLMSYSIVSCVTPRTTSIFVRISAVILLQAILCIGKISMIMRVADSPVLACLPFLSCGHSSSVILSYPNDTAPHIIFLLVEVIVNVSLKRHVCRMLGPRQHLTCKSLPVVIKGPAVHYTVAACGTLLHRDRQLVIYGLHVVNKVS